MLVEKPDSLNSFLRPVLIVIPEVEPMLSPVPSSAIPLSILKVLLIKSNEIISGISRLVNPFLLELFLSSSDVGLSHFHIIIHSFLGRYWVLNNFFLFFPESMMGKALN